MTGSARARPPDATVSVAPIPTSIWRRVVINGVRPFGQRWSSSPLLPYILLAAAKASRGHFDYARRRYGGGVGLFFLRRGGDDPPLRRVPAPTTIPGEGGGDVPTASAHRPEGV